jgi:drug/metabolite transporter (DMT)-like permease
MIYLLGSIVLSSYLTLAFKMCERLGINTFQAIVFNYLTCVITGSIFNGAFPVNAEALHQTWFHWALFMGAMFIGTFNIIALTAKQNGVAVASVANKLSLVIPFLYLAITYHEPLQIIKIIGIILALVAVVFTCWPQKNNAQKTSGGFMLLLLPFILFIASGVLDTILKHVQTFHLNPANNNPYLISCFFAAFVVGFCILLYLVATGKQKLSTKNIIAGICIGIPNYFSIWCLVKFLDANVWKASAAIPMNNIGIVLFSTVVAWIVFKEKLSRINWIGIVLSVVAILLIAYGDQLG